MVHQSDKEALKNNRLIALFLLSILPILFFVVSFLLSQARGPFWLGSNSDPSYPYLFNSLLILNSEPPFHIDHPGTTVHILGAAIIKLTHLAIGKGEMNHDVLENPETYLGSLQASTMIITVFSMTFAARLIYQVTRSWNATILFQVFPLLNMWFFWGSLWVSPESLLIPLSVLYSAFCFRSFLSLSSATNSGLKSFQWILLAGVIAGVALVTKVLFAPLLTLGIICGKSLRGGLAFLAVATATVALCLVPIYSELKRMFGWFESLATHQGVYGGGSRGFVNSETYFRNVIRMAETEPLAVTIILFSLFIGLLIHTKVLHTEATQRRLGKVLWMTGMIQVIGYLLVAKHPAEHYLLSILGSTSLNGAFLGLALTSFRIINISYSKLLCSAAVVTFTLSTVPRLSTLHRNLRANSMLEIAAFKEIQALRDFPRVDFYRCSSPEFAVHFANGYTRNYFAADLAEIYPNSYVFNIWNGKFCNFKDWIEPSQFFSRYNSCYLFGQGSQKMIADLLPMPEGLVFQTLYSEGERRALKVSKDE